MNTLNVIRPEIPPTSDQFMIGSAEGNGAPADGQRRDEPGGAARAGRPNSGQGRARGLFQTAKLLTAQEERELAERIKGGDLAARQRLIVANMRLVINIAKHYKCSGMTLDDLIQEGSLGLIRAARDFDPVAHNTRFSTYASFWIRHRIQRAIAVNGSLIRFPDYIHILRSRFNRVVNELRGQNASESEPGEEPADLDLDLEAVAAKMGISVRRLDTVLQSSIERSSYYTVGDDGDVASCEDMIADRYQPDRDLEHAEEFDRLHDALGRLTSFEAWVIRERFGLNGLDGQAEDGDANEGALAGRGRRRRARSFAQLGRDCGLSIHRLRRIEKLALEKLHGFLEPRMAEAG